MKLKTQALAMALLVALLSVIYLTSTASALPTGTITINGGDLYTTSRAVTLTLSADSGVTYMRFSEDYGNTWGSWYSYTTTFTYTITDEDDGYKYVDVQYWDGTYSTAGDIFDGIYLDTTAPTGSITINDDDVATGSTSVTLQLTYNDVTSGVDQVRYGNVGGSWSAWESPSATKSWTLTSGDGNKYVYYQIRDNAGLISTGNYDDIILDTEAPTCTITINSDNAYTSSTSVTLQLTYDDSSGSGIESVHYGNYGGSWSAWESPSATKSWTLTSGDGEKSVWYQVVDYAGYISTQAGDYITLDTTAPTGSIVINGGDESTASTSVTLQLSYSDATSGVDQVRYSNDGTWDTEPWESPTATKAWTLTTGDGEKTVYYQVMDGAGNLKVFSDEITLGTPDVTPPTGSIVVDGGAVTTASASVTLTLSAEDVESGVAEMRFSNDGVSWSSWESYATSKAWTLAGGAGVKTVLVQFKNGDGFGSVSYSDSIELVGDVPDFETLTFTVTVGDGDYIVATCSNSSVSGVSFDEGLKRLRFNVDGDSATIGLCNMSVPADLMWGDFSLYLDDVALVADVDYTESFNGTHYMFSISYMQSSHTMDLFSTAVIPDFAGLLFLPFVISITLIGITISKKLNKNEEICETT